jgi:serine protease Do
MRPDLFIPWRRLSLLALLLAPAAHALSPEEIFERLAPSVWVVSTFNAQDKALSLGSAIAIEKDRLVTNCHVLAGAKRIKIAHGKQVLPATLEHPDIDRDLCLISVPDLPAPAVPLDAIAQLKVGQKVYAIGSPRGLELAMSDGIISALRDISDGSPPIQTTASIAKGSSGGGLFDANAKLIGITTFQNVEGQNLNLAYPATWILEVPERAKAALAVRAEKASAAKLTAAASAASAPSPSPDRQLLGEEFRRHVVNVGVVSGASSPYPKVRLDFRTNGNLYMRNLDGGRGATAAYTLKEADSRICISVNDAFSGSNWKMLEDCYRLFEVGAGNFVMRSVSDGSFIAYSKP